MDHTSGDCYAGPTSVEESVSSSHASVTPGPAQKPIVGFASKPRQATAASEAQPTAASVALLQKPVSDKVG